MSARRVSREPYRVRRDRRELLVAIGVAALIVLFTVGTVWILAPGDESDDTPSFTPTPTVPIDPTADTTPETTSETPPEAPPDATTADPGTAPPAGG